MNVINCVIVDDEALARELLVTHTDQMENLNVIAVCENALEANEILQKHRVDLLLLDIELPVLKGTDFLKSLSHKPDVIFTTAYRDYALDGFELDAVDYLLKPITFRRFFQAIEKFMALQSMRASANQATQTVATHMFVKVNRKQVKLQFDQILYLKSLKDYVEIHLKNKKKHLVKSTLSAIVEKLGSDFLRVHRSFVVNLAQITAFTNHDLEIGNLEIPLGDQYKTAVLNSLKSKSLDH